MNAVCNVILPKPSCRMMEILLCSVSFLFFYAVATPLLPTPVVFLSCLNLSLPHLSFPHTFLHPTTYIHFLFSASLQTCLRHWLYPGTWMCLWTQWEQSYWCTAVIPLLQRDTAVSCHGRWDDLYSALCLWADVNVNGLMAVYFLTLLLNLKNSSLWWMMSFPRVPLSFHLRVGLVTDCSCCCHGW